MREKGAVKNERKRSGEEVDDLSFRGGATELRASEEGGSLLLDTCYSVSRKRLTR